MRKNGDDFFQNITIQSDDICFSKEQLLSLMQSEKISPGQKQNASTEHNKNTSTRQDENSGNNNTATAWTEQIQVADLVRHAERSTLESIGLETEQHGNYFLLFGLLLCASGMLLLWKRKGGCRKIDFGTNNT